MQFTNIHQMIGYRGVVFDVLEFEVMRRSQFGALYFDVARQVNDRIIERVIKVYDRMQARERPCLLKVSISKPLNRDQCDALNAQRWTLTSLIPGTARRQRTAVAAKINVPAIVAERLRHYHVGDRLIGIDASVHGGLGPRQLSTSMILKH
ncbi:MULTISPECIES: hypothetical protein [Pseudomonas]|uniref:Uncharacterized protein n=2 Tax=Pseudomonas TaxID=286 RepID=A0AAX0W160_9PSED|nr:MULTISPECIES: hypothetical protein [Pseudomonas]MBH3359551.1 hypothetical protein [Pseudomonas guariconensis]MCO7621331.1 hypothetical protein [Pseudomonas guariconensis]MDM9593193.1 hypothetical protein [Pseudomonas guariconensis]MDM9606020.1 hypothetical protein [Pseudomonas guariconensis]MDM9610977.1 hypothetical protein [Pseudomonas guariconensis]